MSTLLEQFEKALKITRIEVDSYNPQKVRSIGANGKKMAPAKFTEIFFHSLGPKMIKFKTLAKLYGQSDKIEELVEEYVKKNAPAKSAAAIPEEIRGLVLNINKATNEAGFKRFFCTTKEEYIDPDTSGQYFIEASGLTMTEAVKVARPVIPKYFPHSERGISEYINPVTGVKSNLLNTYIPPEWVVWKEKNPDKWEKIPTKLPPEILRMLKHIIPLKEERNFFYAWTYASMISRCFTYLVLCGAPGVGKNRLQVLFRALHGKFNTVAGKKETLGANDSKFNSQMADNTLIWFDELKYDSVMEPRMKEYQNPNISIERKGVDASQSTEIYSSMVISNNHNRDNYILFNSRKFAPLVLGTTPLTDALTEDEISILSERLDVYSPNFDVEYVAQIAKWIMRAGERVVDDWPNMEYQGPMFWTLAHSSMSRWQKVAVLALTSTKGLAGTGPGWDSDKGAFLWSKVEASLRARKELEPKDYRDATTVRAFFDMYCDSKGNKAFETEEVGNSIIKDFWIKPISKSGLTDKQILDMALDTGLTLKPVGMSETRWKKIHSQILTARRVTGGEAKRGRGKKKAE